MRCPKCTFLTEWYKAWYKAKRRSFPMFPLRYLTLKTSWWCQAPPNLGTHYGHPSSSLLSFFTNKSLNKSERINALRQQYDAYLEEDKKRKERNEFIISKLGSMCLKNSLVPLRGPMHHYMTQDALFFHNSMETPVKPKQDAVKSRVPHLDEDLVKEITRRFILIPRHPVLENYDKNNIEDEMVYDWRSKYNILKQLKTQENTKCDLKSTNIIITPDKDNPTAPEPLEYQEQIISFFEPPLLLENNVEMNTQISGSNDVTVTSDSVIYHLADAEQPFEEVKLVQQTNTTQECYEVEEISQPLQQNITQNKLGTNEYINNENSVNRDCSEENSDDVIYANVTINKTLSEDIIEPIYSEITQQEISSLTDGYNIESHSEDTNQELTVDQGEFVLSQENSQEPYTDEIESIKIADVKRTLNEIQPAAEEERDVYQNEYQYSNIQPTDEFPVEVTNTQESCPAEQENVNYPRAEKDAENSIKDKEFNYPDAYENIQDPVENSAENQYSMENLEQKVRNVADELDYTHTIHQSQIQAQVQGYDMDYTGNYNKQQENPPADHEMETKETAQYAYYNEQQEYSTDNGVNEGHYDQTYDQSHYADSPYVGYDQTPYNQDQQYYQNDGQEQQQYYENVQTYENVDQPYQESYDNTDQQSYDTEQQPQHTYENVENVPQQVFDNQQSYEQIQQKPTSVTESMGVPIVDPRDKGDDNQ